MVIAWCMQYMNHLVRRQDVDHAVNNIENLREYLEKNTKELYVGGWGSWSL